MTHVRVFAVVFSALVGCAPPPGPAEDKAAADQIWTRGPDLPQPVANNAVVGLEVGDKAHVYSFLGIDASKRWDGVVNWAFRWTVGEPEWVSLPPVPGPGRLAATAEAWGGKIYLFGGYTVAEDGSEASLPNVDVFDPATESWSSAAPMPVPVDDAVSGVWGDSLIVLVSGWHNDDNVPDVQLYDPRTDRWSEATPIPGPPVFGHAGKVSGDQIIYLGGANTGGTRPRYRIEPSAWEGRWDSSGRLRWSHQLTNAPGPPLYRAAAAAVGPWVVFAGGTDNPYNYDGEGYDGQPAKPRRAVFGFDTREGVWVQGPPLPDPRMDHRALGRAGGRLVLVGGMDDQRTVRQTVYVADEQRILEALRRAGPR